MNGGEEGREGRPEVGLIGEELEIAWWCRWRGGDDEKWWKY